MKLRYVTQLAASGILALALCASAAASDRRTANTVIGAGLGAVAGAVLSNGDPMLTIGGAAAGGLLGNVLTEDRGHRHGHAYRDSHYRPAHQRVDARYRRGGRGYPGNRRFRHR